MTPEEQNNLVDMVAQAVIDRIEQNQQINHLTDLVVKRVIEAQRAEAAAKSAPDAPTPPVETAPEADPPASPGN